MEILTLITLILTLIFFLLFVPISFSLFGLWLSELGLFFTIFPIGLITTSIVGLVRFYLVFEYDFYVLLILIFINVVILIRLIVPFLSLGSTHKHLEQTMKNQLGENYLSEINPNINVEYYTNVKFKLFYYLRGINKRKIEDKTFIEREVVYHTAHDKKHTLNIYYPKREGIFPVIIFLHGGAWVIGSKDYARHERLCLFLASLGYCVFNVNYHLVPISSIIKNRSLIKEQPILNEMVLDISLAINFAKKNASKFKGNNKQLFIFGRSAGGHLALLTSFVLQDSDIIGSIGLYPVTDLLSMYNYFKEKHRLTIDLINGATTDSSSLKDLLSIYSPIKYITQESKSNIAPVFLATGLRDRLVKPEQSEILFEKLQELKITSVLLKLPWANHAFDAMIYGPGGQLVLKYLSQFLAWILSQQNKTQ